MSLTHMFRRAALAAAALLCCLLTAVPVFAADTADFAPYAEEGDLDYIRSYVVTVDLREDGSADITYDIDWQVIDGEKTDYLSWVKIGLANSYVDELTPLTDTISDLQYIDEGGSYARVVFARRYYSPAVAAANGGESSVQFAFRVHQSHLFTRNDDGTASFTFTPGWFDELSVESMQVRWRNGEGFFADNTGVDGDYLVWDFGPMTHGQAAKVHVTVPVTSASVYDPNAELTAEDYGVVQTDYSDRFANFFLIVFFTVILLLIFWKNLFGRTPAWGGGFGYLDPADWFWYTNGVHTIRRARTAPPPPGYHRTDPPKNFRAGGGSSRGGGVGRRSGGSNHHSGCACACASSCACACACAGGGRAGCSVKDFYTVKLPRGQSPEGETPHES